MSSVNEDFYSGFQAQYEKRGYTLTRLINCYKKHAGLEHIKTDTLRQRVYRGDEETILKLTMFMFEKHPEPLEDTNEEEASSTWSDAVVAVIVIVLAIFAFFWIFQNHEENKKKPTHEKIRDELESKNISLTEFADCLYGKQNDDEQGAELSVMPKPFYFKICKQLSLSRPIKNQKLLDEYLEFAQNL